MINNIQRLNEKFAEDLFEMQGKIKEESNKFTSIAEITEYFPKLTEWNNIREAIAVKIISKNKKDHRRVR